jgi:hypothetical protein
MSNTMNTPPHTERAIGLSRSAMATVLLSLLVVAAMIARRGGQPR